ERAAAEAAVDAGLGAEVRALDRARSAMQSGRPDDALRALEQYEREFSGGALAPEARVMRIDALRRAGRTAQAEAMGRDFLARHPDSPHARRVRSLIAGAGGGHQNR
ncbi:MAG: tetratricopeptide repeat protein, partial [Deltaproteobacteria bacterium]|nr:tetratricopeptide repeat protein [Deltaproteobacteria bacterium]MBW2533437.1 tetratricopeptide repeat protein [Deltaproteobacteria bacterium]